MEEKNYKVINTQNLWEYFKKETCNLSIENGCLKLQTTREYEFVKDIINDKNLKIKDIAVDEYNIIYILNQNKVSLYDSANIENNGCKLRVLPIKLESPSGIGVIKDRIYIADNKKITAYNRNNLNECRELSKFKDQPLGEINGVATGFEEFIYIIVNGEKPRVLKIKIEKNDGFVINPIGVEVLSNPTDIAVDKKENIYVLDGKKVRIFDKNGEYKDKDDILIKEIIPEGLAVDLNGQIFVKVYQSSDEISKEKATIYKLDKNGTPTPLWSYRDAAGKLITDSKSNLYIINNTGNKLTFLKNNQINKVDENGLFSGYYISKPIDSNDTKTRWRRFLLEGDFQEGSQIEFSYYISNDNSTDNNIIYSERLWHKGLTGTSSVQGEEKREALFQEDIQGRYLRFKITLIGNENVSPIVKSLKVFFPERSFIDYLPAIYQGDNTIRDFPENFASSGFLERFLSIFESIYFNIDFEIDHLSRLFDAWGIDSEFISWLGSWLAIPLEENFPENMKRLYIHKAISLYKKRGTKEGLEETIAFFLYTKKHPYQKMKDIMAHYHDEKPFVIENFNAARLPGNKRIKQSKVTKDILFFPPPEARTIKPDGKEEALLDALFGKEPFSFYVYLRDTNLDENIINTIKRIIDEQKPAHTCYGLKMLEPAFHLDMHTYLEVNTVLTKSGFIIGKTAVMGRNTILNDKDLD